MIYCFSFISLLFIENENKSNSLSKMIYLSINKFYNVYFIFVSITNWLFTLLI